MEPLIDPYNDRGSKEIQAPPHKPLSEDILYKYGMFLFLYLDKVKPDWKVLKDHLHKEGRLSKKTCFRLLKDILNMISK
jgi:serine/threonine-protein phosphatase 2B catalytic subunit